MKTVEEAAKDYVNQYLSDSDKLIAEDGFIKGIEFAQQWIKCEDEMPEGQGWCLVLIDIDDCEYVVEAQYDGSGFFGYFIEDLLENDNIDVTFIAWRPIERK